MSWGMPPARAAASPSLEHLPGAVHEPDLCQRPRQVEESRRWERPLGRLAGLGHHGEGAGQVAEEQLEATPVVNGSDGEVGEPVRHGILMGAPKPHVALVVPTEELVRQPQVEVEQAPGARRDLGGERHPLEQLTRALPFAHPPVEPGALDGSE